MMFLGCIGNVLELFGGERLLLAAGSLLLAGAAFYALKAIKNTKARLAVIYAHLFFAAFPVVLFSSNLACSGMCMPCQNDTLALVGYAVPGAALLAVFAGFIVIPLYYVRTNRKREIASGWMVRFVARYAKTLGMKQPRLYAVDTAEPMAFSFRSVRSAIFVSVGMLDILKKREVEAVLLHELAHLRERSSALKFTGALMRWSPFSLLMRFHDHGDEERKADAFVIREQKTSRHLRAAKRRISRFSN